MNEGKYLVVLSGPSGVGKDTVAKALMAQHPEIKKSTSATSRGIRPGEMDGVNYYYMTREAFEEQVVQGNILEHTCYAGNYYGTPKAEVDRRIGMGQTVVLVIEVEGAGNIKKLYPDSLTIFVNPPSWEALETRLRGRGTEAEDVIAKRMERARVELAMADRYDAQVVNDTVETCAEDVFALIQKHQKADEA